MKIWFDSSPDDHREIQVGDDCGDCDDCADYSLVSYPIITSSVMNVDGERGQREAVLSWTPLLYVQQCGEGRWFVCNPTEAGYMAVLDASAMSLFELFQQPMTVRQACRLRPNWLANEIEHIAMRLYQWGFLRLHDEVAHMQRSSTTPEKLTAWIHITNECNLRCHYCYLQKTREDLPDDVGRRAIDAVFRSALKHNMHGIKLKYAGGEASLHMKSLIALHDYAVGLAEEYDIRLEAVLLSNGVVLSQRTIDHLKARHIAVSISLDGLGLSHDSQRPFRNGQGSSRYVLRTIDRLLANGIIPHISITISQRNLDGLPELVSYVLAHELPFSLNYYRENECSAHINDLRFADAQIIEAMRSVFKVIEGNLPRRSLLSCLLDKARLQAPHTHTCGVGHNYLVIDQRGGIAKCQVDIQRTVATIDMEDPLQAIRDDRDAVQGLSVEEKEGCRTCTWRYWCTGGCPLLTYKATGRYDVKSPNCAIYKALFPDVLRLEALRLLRYEEPFVFNQCNESSEYNEYKVDTPVPILQ
jgi:uncharacterized protein